MKIDPRALLVVFLAAASAVACAGTAPALHVEGTAPALHVEGTAPALHVEPMRVEYSEPCFYIDFDPSGDVRLCDKKFAHWSGRRLMAEDLELFALDGDVVVVDGKPTARLSGDEIVPAKGEPTPDKRIRMDANGDLVDGTGTRVGRIRPAPKDRRVVLVGLAAVAQGVVAQALRVGFSLGTRSYCTCSK